MHKESSKKDNIEEFQIEFYEKIIKERPNFIEALKLLAELYTKSGKFEKGLELDKKLTELLPDDPLVHYNLACSYSLLNDINNSLISIKKAIAIGYNDFKYMNNDPDLINLRIDKRFEDIFSKRPQ
ncbi:MAG: tetratricopeptide repeat protein [Candidatus Omnitrophota bacterium]